MKKKQLLRIGLPILIVLLICGAIAGILLGNKTTIRNIIKKDKTAPVITIEGDKTLTMEVGETLSLPNVTATDDVDGDVTKKIKKKLSHGTELAELGDDHFTTEVGGTYHVIYRVSDKAGNEAVETLDIVVSTKTPEKSMEGSNDLSVLNQSGALFYENFEKGPENELLYDNYKSFYTLTGMENAISGNSLVVDYGKALEEGVNRVTFLSMMPYIQSGTWEISFDVKLVSGEGRDDFYIMYTPNVDKGVYYSERLLLADMKEGEVRHIEYKKVIEVLEEQKGTATFFLCNSNLDCGDVVLMFDNFSIRRTDLEYTTYVPTVKELEKGFTYDWSDEKYATLGEVVNVKDIKDDSIRTALQQKDGFSDRVMLVTNDSLLNGILAANNAAFFEQGREYTIEINYYVASCEGSSLVAQSGSTSARGVRDNLFLKRKEADSVTLRYLIGRGEEELCFYLFGYPAEVYIGDITLTLKDRTDKERYDYHTLTEQELYAGYTFDFSKNNLPKWSGNMMFIGNYGVNDIAASLPKGYFKSGETVWANGMYEFELEFLDGLLKKDRAYDITFRFYSDLPMIMDSVFLVTRDAEGNPVEKNRLGLTDLGNGMYELHTQFRTDGTEVRALFYTTQMVSMYLDSVTVSMQDAKPVVTLDKGIKNSYTIDFDKEWMNFCVRNSVAGYVSSVPDTGGYGLYVKLNEILRFNELTGLTPGRAYQLKFTTKHTGKYGEILGFFVNTNSEQTGPAYVPSKVVSGDTVTYTFTFTADEYAKNGIFALYNKSREVQEEFYITDVEIWSAQGDSTSLNKLTQGNGYSSDFDNKIPALSKGQWVTSLPKEYKADQEKYFYINLNEASEFAMDFSIFDGMVKKGYYYTLSMTGYVKNGDGNVVLIPMDETGNYAEYKTVRTTLPDGQTKLTWYFNGGDYYTGRICQYLRLVNASFNDADFEMYISGFTMQAVSYDSLETGTLDKTANKVIFPNVYNVDDYNGPAESVIILNNGKVALIDSGEAASETSKFLLLQKLKKLGVKKLDVVVMTHLRSEHYGAFTMLADYFDIGEFYAKDTCFGAYEINGNGIEMEKAFNRIMTCIKNKVNSDGSKVKICSDTQFGQKVAFGNGGEFVFYYAREVYGENLADGATREKWDANYFSMSVRYNTKEGYDAYFAGDSLIPTNQELLTVPFENCEIWQINGHGIGNDYSGPYTTERLVTLVDPKYAVVCGVEDNLKQCVKDIMAKFADIEICYLEQGDREFDINALTVDGTYKALTEQELRAGYTYDLSEDSIPRVTSSYVDVTYMSGDQIDTTLPAGYFQNGTAIKAAGRFMVNLDFLNGLIQKNRSYDMTFRVYAPNGLDRAATYIQTTNEKESMHEYYRVGFTELGNGMYDLHAQITCWETERLFSIYSDVDQTYYIESIKVSMQDAKPEAVLDNGIHKNYTVDFDKEWLSVKGRNTNAGYVSSVPNADGYGLYVKLNESLRFEQLTGFTEGRTYELKFTTKHTGHYGWLLGFFVDTENNQLGTTAYTPAKTVSGDTVTYTFTFTADEYAKNGMFALYNNSREVEEEFYITDVEIWSGETDTTSLEKLTEGNGYVSDFDKKVPNINKGQWVTELPAEYTSDQDRFYYIHLNRASDYAMDFNIFDGMVKKGYYYTLSMTGFVKEGAGNILLLPMDGTGNYAEYKTVRTTLEDGQTKLTWYFNGGDYNTGRICQYLRLVNASWDNADFEMYVSEITMQAVSYDDLETGTLDKMANKIIFPNINDVDDYSGNAESVIVLNNGSVALIDGGERSSETSKFLLLQKLKKLGVTKLDVVIMTHPHGDHYGAFTMLAEYFDIGAYYAKDTDWSYENSNNGTEMEKAFDLVLNCMKNKVNSNDTKVQVSDNVTFGQKVTFGDGGEFVFYYAREVFGENLPEGTARTKWDGNYFSLGIRYNTKDGYDAYFAGDSAEATNQELLTVAFENCEIWQINHHGSSGPYTTMRLVTLLDPEYAVVCGTKDNLKQDVKNIIENYGKLNGTREICYPAKGDVEFDLEVLETKKKYKALTEQELYDGYTYDLSENNMPRVTSGNLSITYMSGKDVDVKLPEGYFASGTAIKAAGRYMVKLEFLNGLIQKNRTYDLKFRVYAPDGISKAVTYIQATNEKESMHEYYRVGFTDLGNDMYDLHAQISCYDTESLFSIYSDTDQTFYIESVFVSMQNAKPKVVLHPGIRADYTIDFDESWLKFKVRNSNAGYVSSVPGVGGYGLYVKLNESLRFDQLTGFTKGKTYELKFTTKHTDKYGTLCGFFVDSNNEQKGTAYTPAKTVSGDIVTYTFTFTADDNAEAYMFALYNTNRSVEEEFYIQSVEIKSNTTGGVESGISGENKLEEGSWTKPR